MRILPLVFLAVAGCATEDVLDTDEVALESNVWQWRGDLQIPNQSSEWQPGLAYFQGELHMIHSGSSRPQELWWSRFDGRSWSQNIPLPWTATGGPALAVFDDQLTMVYRQYGQNRLRMIRYDGSAWGTGVTAGTSMNGEVLRSEPAATVFRDQLYVAYCTDTSLRIDRFDGSVWSQVTRLSHTGTVSCEHVELAVLPQTGNLHLVYAVYQWQTSGRTTRTNAWMNEIRSSNGSSWTAPVAIPNKKTLQPISIVTCGGDTHMTHGGYSHADEIWWSVRAGASAWDLDYQVPNTRSYGGTALGCFAGRPIMVHNGGTNQLWWSEYGS